MNNFYFDKIISVKLYPWEPVKDENNRLVMVEGKIKYDVNYNSKNTIVIDTTTSGLKPNIDFEISMITGGNCYDCTLRLKNFMYLPDIRKYRAMQIEAGYKYSDTFSNKRTVTIDMAIFSSWQESPNPDGYTVFKGVTVGRVNSLFSSNPVSVRVYGKTTVENFINRTAFGATGYATEEDYVKASQNKDANVLKVVNYMPDEYKSLEIEVKDRMSAANGLSMLDSLYQKMHGYFKGLKDNPVTYIQHFYNGTLYVGLLEYSEKLKVTSRVINIISVYNASFNASILNIEAPWDPAIEPGCLVRISTNYFVGENAPIGIDIRSPALLGNTPLQKLTSDEINTGAGLYRVLTSKVQFSSCEDTNRMTLMLIPIKYTKEEIDEQKNVTYNSLREDYEKRALEEASVTTNVVIGTEKMDEDVVPIFSAGIKGNYSTTEVSFDCGKTFSELGIQFYQDGDPDNANSFYKKGQNPKKVNMIISGDDGAIAYTRGMAKAPNTCMVVGRANAWPLILAATYQAYKNNNNDPKYAVFLNDPDTLPAGTTAIIPILPESNDDAIALIQQNKALFEAMKDYYIKHLNNSSKTWAYETAIRMCNMYLLAGGSL